MMLERYWPKADAVNTCIKNEAETADVSVLLAVHQPSPIEQRHAGSGVRTLATEKDLLDAFLTDNVPGGALLMPITGPSGVGKSHIIRWLEAQLRRSAKSDQFHIIKIPKSASLRTVVELILKPLANDNRYAKAREDLTRAVTEVSVADAVRTFRAHLENALSAKRERMALEYRENPGRSHLKALIGHSQMLPRLFTDAAFDQHFAENVLSRVVARALSGRSDDTPDDVTLAQFTVDDLILPKSVDVNQAARPVHDYYIRNIANAGAERLQQVVDLLNEVVDPAISNVFQLEQSTGGITLQDIILAVRQILFEDGQDLVLLVEDFAALAGIQEVLLKVCIHEGEYEGKKVRATMRTAIALTDGYLSFRDTILTRAQREWVIGGRPQSDDEIRAGVVEMVGAYLNAARWGGAELRRLFKQRGPEISLTDWLPAWRDEDLTEAESETVAAFGFNTKGDALFPFNRNAIEQLANRHLALGGRLVFNPRRVINEILRSTLLMRDQFVMENFPPAGFQNLRPTANVANWIAQAHQTEQTARRLASLLAIWGGNPPDATGIAHIPPSIFSAFSLPTPRKLGDIKFVPEPARAKLSITRDGAEDARLSGEAQSTDTTAAPEDPKVANMRAALENWADGTMLEQKYASELRKALFEMVRDGIDWPSLRLRSVELRASWITIPHARGNPQSGRQLAVCNDARDESGAIRAGLLAAFRFATIHGRRWTYPEADDDYVASAAIVDHLITQLTPMLVADAIAQASTLGRTLILQSRIGGLEPSVSPSGAHAVLTALFAKPIPTEYQPFEENWDRLRAHTLGSIDGKSAREVLQAELLARVGSFQGDSGRTPFAIDIVRLLGAVGEASASETADGLPEDVRTFIRPIAESRLWSQLTTVVTKLTTFRSQIADYIDEGFDKTAFIADLQEIVRLLGATGTTPTNLPMSIKEFERSLIEFQGSAIKDLVSKAGIVVESGREQLPKLLNALGAIDLGLIQRTMSFLAYTTTLINAAEVSVAREELDRSHADPDSLAAEIKDMLRIVASQPAPVGDAAP